MTENTRWENLPAELQQAASTIARLRVHSEWAHEMKAIFESHRKEVPWVPPALAPAILETGQVIDRSIAWLDENIRRLAALADAALFHVDGTRAFGDLDDNEYVTMLTDRLSMDLDRLLTELAGFNSTIDTAMPSFRQSLWETDNELGKLTRIFECEASERYKQARPLQLTEVKPDGTPIWKDVGYWPPRLNTPAPS